MLCRKNFSLAIAVVFLALSLLVLSPRSAAADEISDLKTQVKQMQGQINVLLNRIDKLEQEKTAKASEVPQDVETRVSALEEKMQKPLLSKLADASFNMKGYVQAYYRWQEHDSGEDTSDIRRARLFFYGDVAQDFAYKVQVDLAASSDILRDAILKYKKFSWANVSVGQMLVPFSYSDNVSSGSLDTIIRPLIATNFSEVRDIGFMLDGKVLDNALYYAVGMFNGAGINTADNNENKDFVGRFIYTPLANSDNKMLSGLSFGGALQTGRQPLSGNYEGTRDRYEGLFVYAYDKLTLTAEYSYQRQERTGVLNDETAQGWYLCGTYMVTPKIKGVAMYEQYDPNMDISRDQQDVVTVGGAYFFNDAVRLDLNYRQIFEQKPNDDTNNELILQAQVNF